MPTLSSITDEARLVLDNVVDTVLSGGVPTVRLGVTGLSRSGKTVFITALVHNLVHGGRLPLFKAYAEGRLIGAALTPQPDDDVPRFDYEDHVADLVDQRTWPRSTSRISELRISIDYESASGWKRTFGRGRLNLDIVDYPGEWLLDLALLEKSIGDWSSEAVAMARQPQRIDLAKPWLDALDQIDLDNGDSEETARQLAARFKDYLTLARADEHALSMLPPGRFLMPGDLEGSPALTFSPLDIDAHEAIDKAPLFAMMKRRYDSYRTHIVKPFFRNHFARLDRQIVLVDMLAALNAGPEALADLEKAIADVLAAFRPGKAAWFSSVLRKRIDRIVFAATKADHVHHGDHKKLTDLLSRLTHKAADRARFSGADVNVVALAAVRATREVTVTRNGKSLPALAGIPIAGETVDGQMFDGKTEIALFPGDLPDDPDSVLQLDSYRNVETGDPADSAFRFLRFRPPPLERTGEGARLSLPHIRLDRTLDYLIGDSLS